jgi:hypothetical protein
MLWVEVVLSHFSAKNGRENGAPFSCYCRAKSRSFPWRGKQRQVSKSKGCAFAQPLIRYLYLLLTAVRERHRRCLVHVRPVHLGRDRDHGHDGDEVHPRPQDGVRRCPRWLERRRRG